MLTLPRRATLAGVLALVTVSLIVLAQESTPPDTEQSVEPSALVTTATLRQAPISTTVSGYGTVTAMPDKARDLTLPQAGLITEVNVVAGEAVKRGDTLMKLTNDPASRMAFQQAQTGLELARSDLERTKLLRAQNLATESQLAAAEKVFRDASTTLETQRELGAGAASAELKAPFDGVVLDVPVAPGDRTAAGTVLARAIANGSMQVSSGFSPQDARLVKPGMPAAIELVAEGRPPIEARVTNVRAMVNPTSRLVDVVLEPVDSMQSASLLAAEGVRAIITVAKQTFWLAPRAAVLDDDKGSYLFQIENGHAKRIDVTRPGAEDEQEVAVEGPFTAAARFAVLGAYELEDGMAVHESASDEQRAANDKAQTP